MRELLLRRGIRRTRVLLYDDIDEMPVERFNKANKFWMLSDHLGNSFEDIDRVHLSKLYFVAGDKDKTVKEVNNLRVLVHNIIREVHPNQLAFAATIHSVDGKEVTDITDEGLARVMRDLSSKGLSIGEAKKKITREKIYTELEAYFPQRFKTGVAPTFYSELKRRTLRMLEAIKNKEDISDYLNKSDAYFGNMIYPKNFIGDNSYEMEYERAFEQNCILLSAYTNADVKKISVKEYFSLLQYHSQVLKEREKRYGKKPH